jgi:Calcineurin-like phosphoesterase
MTRKANVKMNQPIFHEPIFSDGDTKADPTGFEVKHPSDTALYNKIGDLSKKDVVSFSKSRIADTALFSLETAYGPHGADVTKKIKSAGKIIFHTIGDSGASQSGKYPNELTVADQVTADSHQSNEANRAAFLFHLGDVVYNFGESQYYYDQFYDPYRNYPAPIFAIPGNHDSFVVPDTPKGQEPLTTFQRNFCSPTPDITKEAGSLHRTAMTQPGVYYTLDAPYVRIIALFSNSLEDPGVISSQRGKWKNVPDYQLDFLTAQLNKIKQDKFQGAVLLATHHPPFSYAPKPKSGGSGGNHSSSSEMLAEIDTICQKVGVYPHAFLSGHAHNYQRYSRIINFLGKEYDVPFIVCGDGGHNVNLLVRAKKGHPAQDPHSGTRVDYLEAKKPVVKTKQLILEKYNDTNYGYLRITVDDKNLKIVFHQVGGAKLAQSDADTVTVELASHTMVSN